VCAALHLTRGAAPVAKKSKNMHNFAQKALADLRPTTSVCRHGSALQVHKFAQRNHHRRAKLALFRKTANPDAPHCRRPAAPPDEIGFVSQNSSRDAPTAAIRRHRPTKLALFRKTRSGPNDLPGDSTPGVPRRGNIGG
jgi:hypothetical protein